MQQLGQRGGLVPDRAVDVVRVQVAGDGVRREALGNRTACDSVGEGAGTVADVEQHAAFPGIPDLGIQPSARVQDAAGVAMEAVRHHVAAAEIGQQPADRRVHVDDVRHQRQAEDVGGLAGPAQRRGWLGPHHLVTQPDLDADDGVRVLPRPAGRPCGRPC